MNNDTPADAITQADRDAAADYCFKHENPVWWMPEAIHDGHYDEAPLVRAFARHRATSLAAQDGLVDALRNALKLAANRFDRLGVNAIAAGRNAEAHEISDWSQEARASSRAALASIEVKSS